MANSPTAAGRRFLKTLAARPSLDLWVEPLAERVKLFDDEDGLWESWTTHSVLDGLARQGLLPSFTHEGIVYADIDKIGR